MPAKHMTGIDQTAGTPPERRRAPMASDAGGLTCPDASAGAPDGVRAEWAIGMVRFMARPPSPHAVRAHRTVRSARYPWRCARRPRRHRWFDVRGRLLDVHGLPSAAPPWFAPRDTLDTVAADTLTGYISTGVRVLRR